MKKTLYNNNDIKINYYNNGKDSYKSFKNDVTLPCKEVLLWWQKRGLMYTATGYGSKIPTRYMVQWKGRWYRVYCSIFSNSGTCFIVSKKETIYIDDYNMQEVEND